jgi:hypothetical protein
MKKLHNEPQLVKEAIRIGLIYAQKRGVAEFEATDSADLKVEYLYKLLVHDKQIEPLAKSDLSLPTMKHKLALWVQRHLPENHPLKH